MEKYFCLKLFAACLLTVEVQSNLVLCSNEVASVLSYFLNLGMGSVMDNSQMFTIGPELNAPQRNLVK